MSDCFVVGIAGGSGSGKSTLVKTLASRHSPQLISMLNHDCYYLDAARIPAELRLNGNWDHPAALDNQLFTAHVDLLQKGQEVEEPVYDFATHSRSKNFRKVSPSVILLLEGVLLFAIPEILSRIHLRVFIDVSPEERLARRIRRDVSERGRSPESVTDQFLKTVQPMHDLLIEPSRSHADVILPQTTTAAYHTAVDSILSRIGHEISLRQAR